MKYDLMIFYLYLMEFFFFNYYGNYKKTILYKYLNIISSCFLYDEKYSQNS